MIKSILVKITPAIAKKMLKQNTNNRKVSKQRVRFYAEEMQEGRWKTNGDSVRFSGSRIIDGQHRLLAIVKSGKCIKIMVTTGLKSDVFSTIDRGFIRSVGQILQMSGETQSNNLGAAISTCITDFSIVGILL